MDSKPPQASAHAQGNFQAEHGDYPSPRARKPGRRQAKRTAPPEPVGLLLKTVRHFQGNLIESLYKTFGSAKNSARRLAESLRFHLVPDDLVMPGQIRFRPP